MPWNKKTTKRDRKRWGRFLRRNYRAQKRELRLMAGIKWDRDLHCDTSLRLDHLPLPPTLQFMIELFNLDGFEK